MATVGLAWDVQAVPDRIYAEAEAVKAARRTAPSVVDADGPVGLELVEESESA